MRTSSFLAAFLLLAACADSTSVSDDLLLVRRVSAGLDLENRSTDPVHTFVVEAETATRINWLACAGPGCAAIAPGANLRVRNEDIAGYSARAQEAIVYWWRSVPNGAGGFRTDEIKSLRVPL